MIEPGIREQVVERSAGAGLRIWRRRTRADRPGRRRAPRRTSGTARASRRRCTPAGANGRTGPRRRAGRAARRGRPGRRTSRSLWRFATTTPAATTTAPTGTSPSAPARRASAIASSMAAFVAANSADGSIRSSRSRVPNCDAEEVGFEPTVGCPTHDFQSCRFGRSRTPPGSPDAIVSPSCGALERSGRVLRDGAP